MLIAQITDLHVTLPDAPAYGRVNTGDYLRKAVARIAALEQAPDLVIATGDLVDHGTVAEYAELRKQLAPLTMPVHLIPGNHDDREALRAAFADHAYLPRDGSHLHYVIEGWPVRLIGLDTIIPGEAGGRLCAERLAWLDRTLNEGRGKPTLIFMHHPPFETGLAAMDAIGLEGAAAMAEILSKHPQVQLVTAGHLHRVIVRRIANTVAMTCPSTAHQVTLDLRRDAETTYTLEPPAFQLHLWNGSGLVSHTLPVEKFPGPYPFTGFER